MPNLRRAALAALAAGLFALAAAGAEPKPQVPLPAAELTAAAGRWKLDRAAERAAQPGAAGQHDLFWEILRLWEKDEKARADADLEAVMSWLLFDAGLAGDGNLADPVYGKLPALAPRLGERLLDRRLGGWIATVQAAGASGGEPWLWAEFPGMDRKALAEAVAALCLATPGIRAARVRVDKPSALRFARSVAVEIVRRMGPPA